MYLKKCAVTPCHILCVYGHLSHCASPHDQDLCAGGVIGTLERRGGEQLIIWVIIIKICSSLFYRHKQSNNLFISPSQEKKRNSIKRYNSHCPWLASIGQDWTWLALIGPDWPLIQIGQNCPNCPPLISLALIDSDWPKRDPIDLIHPWLALFWQD